VAGVIDGGDRRLDAVPLDDDVATVRRDPLLGEPLEAFGVGRVELRPFDELVEDDAEVSLRDLTRVEHPHRAGGGVAGVGERLEPFGLALDIDRLEVLAKEEHFAAEGDAPFVGDAEGHATKHAEVDRDVLSRLAVAACAREHETPPFEDCLYASAVELWFDAEPGGLAVR
jgi:hypothetical protein